MDGRNKSIHQFWHFAKMGRNVASNINRLFTKSAAELGNVCNRDVVQSPERIFIESRMSLLESYLDTVREKIVLSN